MQKKGIRCLCMALAVMLLAGCASAGTPGTTASSSAAAGSVAADGSLRMTQESSVTSKNYEKQDKYAQFLSQAKPFTVIPGLNQGMVPQGMGLCAENGRIYISGYFSEDADLPSAIVSLDAQTGAFQAEYYLYYADGSAFASHVGGVAVTKDTLYVSATLDNDGSYTIAAIPLAQLADEGSHNVTVETLITVPVSPSFMNYSDGMLWIGNFYHPDKDYDLSPEIHVTTPSADGELGCYILGYEMGDKEADFLAAAGGEGYPVPDCVLAAPDKIQGMTMLENGTVVLSQSYGRKNDSALLSYTLSLKDAADTTVSLGNSSVDCWILDSTRKSGEMTVMPMTEALSCIPGENAYYVLFESGAMHYSDGKYRTDSLWRLDVA